MGDIQGSSVQGVNYPRRKMYGCNYLGAIFLGGNCMGGNCPRWDLSGDNCPEGIVPFPSPGVYLYPFGKQGENFFRNIMYQISGNADVPMTEKCHILHLHSVCSYFSFLKLLFPLQNKSYGPLFGFWLFLF